MSVMDNNHEQVPALMPEIAQNREDSMWLEAEHKLKIKIPDSVKNMLLINGFETEALIATIDEKVISEIEMFAQTDLLEIIKKDDYKKYYGIYAEKPIIFKFLVGHRKLILMLVDYFKRRISSVIMPSTKKKKKELGKPQKNEATIDNPLLENETENSPSLTEETSEEAQKVLNTLKNWAKLRVEPVKWKYFEEDFDTIRIEIQHLKEANRTPYCIIYCFCGGIYRIPKLSKTSSGSPRWVYSNYQSHLSEKHMQVPSVDTKIQQRNVARKIATKPIDSYFRKNPNKTINILQDITISAARSPATSNDLSQEKTVDVEDNFLQSNSSEMLCGDTSNPESGVSENHPYKEDIKALDNSRYPKSKWKNAKYSRAERLKRGRESIVTVNQSLMTDYYSLVNNICDSLSPEATDTILDHIPETSLLHNSTFTENKKEYLSSFLQRLLANALENSNGKENKNTFDEVTKKISLYLFYTAGRLVYETLQANLKDSLPSVSTLYRFVGEKHTRLDEGSIDFRGLNNFLEKKNIPKVVWISEDGTRVNGRIEYDPVSNKLVGFVLPQRNGVLEKNAFLATSATAMQHCFQTGTKAAYAYVIVAQPLTPGTPAYCMGLFGTDNKFTYKDIIKRWRNLKEEAAKFGITILGYSADGDTRLLKAMRLLSGLGTLKKSLNSMAETSAESEYEWFHMDINTTCDCYFQDFIHILTKLRVRYLKRTNHLKIGNYEATPQHLIDIINNVSKDKHLLTMTDVKAEDKMNFSSAENICSDRVLEILSSISDSDGSRIYLQMMNYILSAFLGEEITLCDRVYKIWFVVFLLRAWRSSIKKNKNLTLKQNFISTNCYNCTELNAHNIIKVVLLFKFNNVQLNLKSDMLYFPNMSSQPCEKLIRAARSMTSTYSTIINFSIKDLLYRVNRLNTVNDIIGELNTDFLFPREVKKRRDRQYAMSQEEIVNVNVELVVKRALNDAKIEANKLGFNATDDDFVKLDLQLDGISENNSDELDELEDETQIGDNLDEISDEIDSDKNSSQNLNFNLEEEDKLDLKDYSDKVKNPDENSGYVTVQLKDTTKILKKSPYCWLLAENNGRVSNDRLKRFIVSGSQKPSLNQNLKRNKTKAAAGIKSSTEANNKRLKKKDVNSSTSSSSSEDNISACEKSETEEDFDLDLDSEPFVPDLVIDIQLYKYYAVAYDKQWFIGRITDVVKENNSEDRYKVKFLKRNQNHFVWPRKVDSDIVEKSHFFYGRI